MSLADKFRWFPTPTYGVCGGAKKDCSIGSFDPLDKLFFKHDNDLFEARKLNDLSKMKEAELKADRELAEGLKALTDEDLKQIPALTWKFPFFKRWYAKAYRKSAIKVFS